MTSEPIAQAYAHRASEYIARFGSMGATSPLDRALIGRWAGGLDGPGPVLDVGCGPGQWTAWLHGLGVDIEGVDPVPGFLEEARREHPGVRFRSGRAERLDVDAASVSGILAWYSVIHTDPQEIGRVFAEFARVLRPGGSLLVGFFEGPELVPFDHAVVTAYFWPVGLLVEAIESAGFLAGEILTRSDDGARPHGSIVAQRVPS